MGLFASDTAELEALEQAWAGQWETALAAWSRFIMLSPPRLCLTEKEERQEKLAGSFAMIRLTDHAVVVSLRQIKKQGLEAFAAPILAHEIGHHVYAPANLSDNARLLARIRRNLPTREQFAGLVANLYTDLLINDRLQRAAGLDLAGVYRKLRGESADPLWTLYLRIYEILWSLPSGSLVEPTKDKQLQFDAQLGAKTVRVYARDWLTGASRFAVLLLPYLLKIPEKEMKLVRLAGWNDTEQAGAGEEVPDGLAELGEGEEESIHPIDDEAIMGAPVEKREEGSRKEKAGGAREGGRATVGGKKNQYRPPSEYRELMQSLGVKVSEKDLTVRYYRERAIPYLVPFPTRQTREAADPLPEGVETWEPGAPLADLDWTETLSRSPVIIPGVTTQQRTYGQTEGDSPHRLPLDLYIGIDCSGSMKNPALNLSYPVLAGTVLALSALRAGARVMACLSGDPGEYSETVGFVRQEREIMGVLTNYLGTGYAYGIRRLKATFGPDFKGKRPVHILIVSDSDIFVMLNDVPDGWELSAEALKRAGGGGTFVLEVDPVRQSDNLDKLRSFGWATHCVRDQAEMVAFARAFSRAKYGAEKGPA